MYSYTQAVHFFSILDSSILNAGLDFGGPQGRIQGLFPPVAGWMRGLSPDRPGRARLEMTLYIGQMSLGTHHRNSVGTGMNTCTQSAGKERNRPSQEGRESRRVGRGGGWCGLRVWGAAGGAAAVSDVAAVLMLVKVSLVRRLDVSRGSDIRAWMRPPIRRTTRAR